MLWARTTYVMGNKELNIGADWWGMGGRRGREEGLMGDAGQRNILYVNGRIYTQLVEIL